MKRRTRLQVLVCLLLAAVLATRLAWVDLFGAGAPPAPPYPESPAGPHNVVLVMVDGLRLQDSYKSDRFASDFRDVRNFTPRMTSELLPEGTIYSEATTGAFNTITTACTNTIVTGAWHEGPNRGRGAEASDEDYVDNRTFDRTLFELARRQLALDADDVVFISDKLNTRLSDFGYHPLGGPEWAPRKRVFLTRFNEEERYKQESWIDPVRNSDRKVYDAAVDALDTLEPRVMFLGFGNLDIAGHRSTKDADADFRFYSRAIEIFDHLLVNLWHEIQARPAYRDNTTMIVIGDHGRHSDHDLTAYGSHQGTCEGTRNILCFVAGPYTPRGLVVERRVFQTAVLPTIARLLEIDTPEATGRPLYEAIGIVPEIESRPYARNLDAAVEGDTLWTVIRRGDAAGTDRLELVAIDENGDVGEPRTLVSTPWHAGEFHDLPSVETEGDTVHVAAWHWTQQNHEILHWSTRDGGRSFTGPRVLATGKTEDSRFGEISLRDFEIAIENGTSHVILPAIAQPGGGNGSILTEIRSIGFGGGARKDRRDRFDRPRRIGHHRWLSPAFDRTGALWTAFAALDLPTAPMDPTRSTWEIFTKRLTDASLRTGSRRLTDNNLVPHVMPALAIGPDFRGEGGAAADRATLVYAGLDDEAFALYGTSAIVEDAGPDFPAPQPWIRSDVGAWEPDAAVAPDGTVHLAYVDFAYGSGDVFWVRLGPNGPLDEPTNLSDSPGESRGPRIRVDASGRARVVWEEQDAAIGFRIAHAFAPTSN